MAVGTATSGLLDMRRTRMPRPNGQKSERICQNGAHRLYTVFEWRGLRLQDFQHERSIGCLERVGARSHDAAARLETLLDDLRGQLVLPWGRAHLHLNLSQNDVSLADLVRHGDAFCRSLSYHRADNLCCRAAIFALPFWATPSGTPRSTRLVCPRLFGRDLTHFCHNVVLPTDMPLAEHVHAWFKFCALAA